VPIQAIPPGAGSPTVQRAGRTTARQAPTARCLRSRDSGVISSCLSRDLRREGVLVVLVCRVRHPVCVWLSWVGIAVPANVVGQFEHLRAIRTKDVRMR
jgi:hypothetical protein